MTDVVCCENCIYAHRDLGLWMRTLWSGFPARPICGNHPSSHGRMSECPIGRVCPNFRPRPPKPKGETVKTIAIGDGYYAYVDAADYEWLSQWTWTFHSGYAVRYEKKKQIYMHREIMRPPPGMIVDHKNRNKLDNTRENLRVCTHKENARNRCKPHGSASRFIGVGYDRKRQRWYASLYADSKPIWLGYFDDELQAARGYDHRAVELLGEQARLNFPEEWPPQRIQEVHAHPREPTRKRKRKG
jgi:hypothetical protein